MPGTKERGAGQAGTAFALWTMLTALAVCGSYRLTWLFLLVLSRMQG